jgi:hypothetical protein
MKQPETERITPELIEMYRGWAPGAVAAIYDRRLREIESLQAKTFVELGIIIVECVTRELWKFTTKANGETPHSWTDWLNDCLPVAASTAFSAKKVAEVLAGIPAEERQEIPRGNLEVMADLSTEVHMSEEIRTAAKKLKPAAFVNMVEREHPEQHVQAKKPMRFKPERAGRTVIDGALEMCMVIEETDDRNLALEKVCEWYLTTRKLAYDEELERRKVEAAEERPTVQ